MTERREWVKRRGRRGKGSGRKRERGGVLAGYAMHLLEGSGGNPRCTVGWGGGGVGCESYRRGKEEIPTENIPLLS